MRIHILILVFKGLTEAQAQYTVWLAIRVGTKGFGTLRTYSLRRYSIEGWYWIQLMDMMLD